MFNASDVCKSTDNRYAKTTTTTTKKRKMNTLLFARVHRPLTCAWNVHYNNRQDIVIIISTNDKQDRKQRNYFEYYLCFLSFTLVVLLFFLDIVIKWLLQIIDHTYADEEIVFKSNISDIWKSKTSSTTSSYRQTNE